MSQTPNRSPTHRDVDLGRLANLGLEIEELAGDGPLTPDRVIQLAEEQGKPASHYYAAVALATDLELPTAPVTAVFCAGKCQAWGALDAIDAAAATWEQRPAFAIGVRSCLDKCFDAPVCELRTPAGTATILRAKPDEVVAAITDALDAV
ncbi:MAG TPA: hypothetical protein VM734_31855 [Kofleriaceae bacterium]|jgi:hypothetical protein|nr:hypothetical protein [Kofleriaceae bacterium]